MHEDQHSIATQGIHHISAVASSAADNLHFYNRVLGLRLVKKTVNFDDPFTYHLYYGDEAGHPGTILTFFPWEHLPQGRPGAGMVSAIAFAVPPASLDHWRHRLEAHHIAVQEHRRFEETVIRFADPDGLPLELVAVPNPSAPVAGQTHDTDAIIGFHSATMVLHRLGPTQAVVADAMGMAVEKQEGSRYRFAMGDRRSSGQLLDVVVDPHAAQGSPGAGTVHHIAFRTRDSGEQRDWQQMLRQRGLSVTDVRDRKYFQSIYFHEPGGVLFEIATDPPGFAVDEQPDQLGTALKLPAQYESMRRTIEQRLPPLGMAEFPHVFIPATVDHADHRTIVALHGTGGDENDLIPLVRKVWPTAAVISPRGRVRENGMPRFFRRLADGVFDEADVRHRTDELAVFLEDAANRYDRPADGLIALGYSNGANIAAAVMLLRPEALAGAVLLRPMLPLEPEAIPDLTGVPVLILRGRLDRTIPGPATDRLVDWLRRAGAILDVVELEAGHEITAEDIEIAAGWLAKRPAVPAETKRAAVNQ